MCGIVMTESTTRGFISQWLYDHGRDGRDAATLQWLSVDRVAEHMRQREEHDQEDDLDAMDFETRAAALESHFFQPRRNSNPVSGRVFPIAARPVARARPQSASLSRRAADVNGTSNNRVRPQSAKTRPEASGSTNAIQKENQVAWNAVAQQKPSRWREMLARGPEFKQLTLRRLELETYELLYSTLQQQQVIEPKPTARRRKRKNSVTTAGKSPGYSPALACGSGLHLARSKKKRQQEHDRQMMLGKGRDSSRVDKAAEDKRAIRDKTRTRSKLLKKKKPQKQPPEPQKTTQVSTQEIPQKESYLHRQPSAQRTARSPWKPPGSSSSLVIRGTSSETGETQVLQEKRIAQVLDVFRCHADTHLRLSKNVHKQLKKVQQSVKTARESEPRKMEQKVTSDFAKSTRPKSATSNAKITKHTSDRQISPYEPPHETYDNQEKDEADSVEVMNPSSFRRVQSELQSPVYGSETLFSEAPATPKLVIPPLKFPPRLWEDQQSNDSLDVSSELSPEKSAVVRSPINPRVRSFEVGVACGVDPAASVQSTESKTSNKEDHGSVALDSAPTNSARTKVASDWSCLEQDSQPSDVTDPHQDQQQLKSTRRTNSVMIEEGYLAESIMEQASTGLSSSDTEPSPATLGYELPAMESGIVSSGNQHDDMKRLSGSEKYDDSDLKSNPEMLAKATELHGDTKPRDEDDGLTNEVFILGEISMSPGKEANTRLPVDVNVATSQLEASVCATTESDLKTPEIIQTVKSAECDFICVDQQPVSVRSDTNENSSSSIEADGLTDITKSVDMSNSVIEATLQSAGGIDALRSVGDSLSKERSFSVNEPVRIVSGVDISLSAIATPRTEAKHNRSGEVIPMSPPPVAMSDEGDTKMTTLDSDVLLESKVTNCDQDRDATSSKTLSETQHDHSSAELSDESPLNDSRAYSTDMFPSEEFDEPLQLMIDPAVMTAASDIDQLAHSEASNTFDHGNGAIHENQQQPEPAPADEQREALHENTVLPSNLLSLAMEPLADAETTQLTTASALTSESDENAHEKEQVAEHSPPKTTSPSGRSDEPPSPIISTPKATSNGISPESPEVHGDSSDVSEENPHQQALIRSFLQRVSSRKMVETDSASQPRKEPVECDEQPTELVTAEATAAVMGVESPPLEQNVDPVKEREHIDGDSVSPLGRECSQALNPCESTVETYPRVTEAFAASSGLAATPPTEKATSSTSVDDDGVQETAVQASPQPIDLTEVVDRGPTQASAEHHNAARNIQAQYRCFVRRRLMLDQLRFMVAKQRRQARRQSRLKVKKVKVVDTVAAVASGLEVVDASSVESLPEEVQQVAPASVRGEIGVEVAAETPCSDAPEPLAKDAGLAARKDSCEYAFELFDGLKEESELETSAPLVEDGVEAVPDAGANETSSEKRDAAALPAKVEEVASYEQPTLLLSEATEVEPSSAQPAAPAVASLLVSTRPAELSLSDDAEEDPAKPVDAALVEAAPEPARWERYVDSSTSKSFYYNPGTNATQWTAPEDRDHAAINSTAASATDAAVSPSGHAATGTWQEFLDEASGQLYYYNTRTGECSWDSPGVVESLQSVATAESAWIMYIDPASQAPYYVNVETLATSWEQPDNFVVADSANTKRAGAVEDAYVIAVDDQAALEI
ncbi:hypothetical protein PHYPSEUDO_005986 [Phytophthora pseudosyringae]|uniref:WW domain-containing protein n=1 Tax=Phytophthora pseudosyringae TaxID=221518 RepID=A0A8T1VN47_9STRA|nr:hypothetical protein PHYPSEUDO_005986 [Phytophthora pseudosyringae]